VDLLWHRFWHTAVKRRDREIIQSTASYSDSACELAAGMLVNARDFLIKEAWLEYRGGPGDMADVRQDLPEIRGVEAYLNSGPDLKKIQPRQNGVLAGMLVNECVVGIIQAETFIFSERGYASGEDTAGPGKNFMPAPAVITATCTELRPAGMNTWESKTARQSCLIASKACSCTAGRMGTG
jgi:hypothetical protein